MKILLINDNPVVNKLVTLSAQKTSDELEVVSELDAITLSAYDLVVIDDTLYSEELFTALNEKINFSKSLYICSRDAQEVKAISKTLKKPFLPTDLVELFATFGKEVEDMPGVSQDLEELDHSGFEEMGDLDDMELPDELEELDALGSLEDDEDEDDSFILDLDDEIEELEEDTGESVLDDDEAQEVKNLLDETDSEDDLDLDFDLELGEDEDDSLDIDLEDALSDDDFDIQLEDEIEEDELLSDEVISEESGVDEEDDFSMDTPVLDGAAAAALGIDLSELEDDSEEEDELDLTELEDDLALEDETMEEDIALDTFDEDLELDESLDLETQIESAVEELSEEELESEVDEETLLDIVASDINSLDGLTSRDLKLAVGEEVSALEEVQEQEPKSIEDEESVLEESSEVDSDASTDGVEALKNLLAALSDKKVAATMKGMKISINITLGDN